LRLNVLLDHFISDVARTRSEISARPKVPSPELSAQLAKLLQHLPATASLDALHQITHRHIRWHRHQQVHMIYRYVPTEDVHVQCRARLSHQFTQSKPDFATQHRLPIFRDPHQVIFQIVDSMRCFSIAHGCILRLPCSLSSSSRACDQPLPDSHRLVARPDLDQCGVKTACLKGRGFYPIYRQ